MTKPSTDDTKWMQRAQCDGQNPADFYPTGNQAGHHGNGYFTTDDLERAVAAERCPGCPVITDCLAYALKHSIDWGVWGGRSGEQRIQLRREANRRKLAEERAAARGEHMAT